MLISGKPIKKRSVVQVRLEEEKLHINAKVMLCQEIGEGQWKISMRFEELPDQVRKDLQLYLTLPMLEQLGNAD